MSITFTFNLLLSQEKNTTRATGIDRGHSLQSLQGQSGKSNLQHRVDACHVGRGSDATVFCLFFSP